MQNRLVLLALLVGIDAGCKSVDCGEGTAERNGACVPANETVTSAACGPFTELRGDKCAPVLPPTVCDPTSTTAETDDMGVVTCIGNGGGGGCSATLACPAPTDGKQTICGQLFDFETNTPFAAPNATGKPCTPAATGPCALGMRAYDAVAFAMNPMTAPLTTDPVYIDDCGRYKVAEIPVPGTGFIALGIDDSMQGPGGLTNATGVAASALANTATKDLDAFVVPASTTTAWATSGGPTIASGYYVPVYRGHKTGSDLVAGVTVTYGPMQPPGAPTLTDVNRDFYFDAAATARTTLAAAASVTGVNGTALFSAANLGEVYSGQGVLPTECRWDIHAGASTPGVVFIQVFRPINNGPMTCPL